MLGLISGYWYSQTVSVVARLGIPDLLQRGPRTAATLARQTGTDPEALFRLLRAMAAVGLFRRSGSRAFALTPLSRTLVSDSDGSLRSIAALAGHRGHWRAWGELADSIRTGAAAFPRANGQPYFARMAADRELATLFRASMAGTEWLDDLILRHAQFGGSGTIVDVGGGSGHLLGRFLARYPKATGILADRPEALRSIRHKARIRHVQTEFFRSVPRGGELYLLKFVLHDWDDRRAVQLLRRCRMAMGPESRLIVVEALLPRGRGVSMATTHDLAMLVLTGGRERTRAEYAALFRRAGLRLRGVAPIGSGVSLLEVVRENDRVVARQIH
jgi:hypothetical protein